MAMLRLQLSPSAARRFKRGNGFTLIELLVAVGIIGLLLAILLPAISKVRASAKAIACTKNIGGLMQAFLMFAHDHENCLPGNHGDQGNPDPDKRCWLFQFQNMSSWQLAPQDGTLWKYTKNLDVYRCPAQPVEAFGTSSGSNGHFDFGSIGQFSGAPINIIKQDAQLRHPSGTVENIYTPIIVEEDPAADINHIWADALHCAADRISPVHNGGGHYATIDGSVHWVKQDPNCTAYNLFIQAPSGKWISVGPANPQTWGAWITQ